MIGILHSLSLPIESHLLSSIRPLEHRLEIINGEQPDNNIEWINDSKATNVEATMAGLSATVEYIQKKKSLTTLIILLGGAGKEGAEYHMLLDCITNAEQHNINVQNLCFGAKWTRDTKAIARRTTNHRKKEGKNINSKWAFIYNISQQCRKLFLYVIPSLIVNIYSLSNALFYFHLLVHLLMGFQNFEHRGRVFCGLQNTKARNKNIVKIQQHLRQYVWREHETSYRCKTFCFLSYF